MTRGVALNGVRLRRAGAFRFFALRRLTTPEVLEYSFVALLALSLLAYVTSAAVIGRFKDATTGIGEEAKPAVVIAEQLSVTLADMDAQITDSALGNGQSWTHYLADIDAAVSAAMQANRTVQDGDPEAESLRNVQLRLRNYYQMVGAASVTSPDVFVSNEQLARTTTLWASRTLRSDIIAEAQNAAELASGKLTQAYRELDNYVKRSAFLAIVPLLLLLAVLVAVQVFLTRRTKRWINVPLVLASLTLIGFASWFTYIADTGNAAMQDARETSFSDLRRLYKAKVEAYLMKADQSMWLFELRKARFEQRRLRAFYGRSFSDSARILLDVDNIADYPAAVVEGQAFTDPVDRQGVEATQAALEDAQKLRAAGQFEEASRAAPHIGGIIGGELRHFEAPGADWKSAYDAATYLMRYLDIDRKIRTMALGADRDKAVHLSTGTGEGEANWAFGLMDQALNHMIAEDDAAFDARYHAAVESFGALPMVLLSALAMVFTLSGWGLWLRYREYR
jgi:hypothetical protein